MKYFLLPWNAEAYCVKYINLNAALSSFLKSDLFLFFVQIESSQWTFFRYVISVTILYFRLHNDLPLYDIHWSEVITKSNKGPHFFFVSLLTESKTKERWKSWKLFLDCQNFNRKTLNEPSWQHLLVAIRVRVFIDVD